MPGSPDEAKELDELRALFGRSEVPRGMFVKFEVSKANRAKADKERKEKEERQRLMEEREVEQKVSNPMSSLSHMKCSL